jgi:hypothetical protein
MILKQSLTAILSLFERERTETFATVAARCGVVGRCTTALTW